MGMLRKTNYQRGQFERIHNPNTIGDNITKQIENMAKTLETRLAVERRNLRGHKIYGRNESEESTGIKMFRGGLDKVKKLIILETLLYHADISFVMIV